MRNHLIACLLLMLGHGMLLAQVYPALPFDTKRMADLGIHQVVRWKGLYAKTDADTTGFRWSETQQMDYQETKFVLKGSGEPEEYTRYNPEGNPEERWTYYYPEGKLTAIDAFHVDTTGALELVYTFVYGFDRDKRAVQRTRLFRKGPQREVSANYSYDQEGRVKRIRYQWNGPRQRPVNLALWQYGPQEQRIRYYSALHTLRYEERYRYQADGQVQQHTVFRADGTVRSHSLFKYENGKCVRKQTYDIGQPGRLSKPIARSYYTYNSDGLLEMELREIGEEQIVYTYTYLQEK